SSRLHMCFKIKSLSLTIKADLTLLSNLPNLMNMFYIINTWNKIRLFLIHWLRQSEKYTKVDMVYLASGNFWLTTNRVVGIGTGFMLTLAFANLLPPEIFGQYKYILALAGIIGAF